MRPCESASKGGDGALPVPVQEAYVHARVPDDAEWEDPRAIGSALVAFCCHDGIGTPNCIAFAAHSLAYTHPCQRFT